MCLLSYYPPGVQPDIQRLRNGCLRNRDGFGYAIVVDAGLKTAFIHVRKFMKHEEALSGFKADRAKYPNGPALFHSRMATGGTETEFNVHPFKVGKDEGTYVAHNGIMFSTEAKDPRSDTHYFADEIAPRFYRRLDRKGVRAQLEAFLGSGNKLVFLTVNPRYRQSAYIFNEDLGEWVEGASKRTEDSEWHSNTGYKSAPKYRSRGSGSYYNQSGWDDEWYGVGSYQRYDAASSAGDCTVCGAKNSVDAITDVCDACRSCAQCEKGIEKCGCYASKIGRTVTPGKAKGSGANAVVSKVTTGTGNKATVIYQGKADTPIGEAAAAAMAKGRAYREGLWPEDAHPDAEDAEDAKLTDGVVMVAGVTYTPRQDGSWQRKERSDSGTTYLRHITNVEFEEETGLSATDPDETVDYDTAQAEAAEVMAATS